ncbi:unnamed protein product [Polarella glacialis]|uniref:Aldehyde oxidase/xanthine dehydrogenase a/b hammerhead domain-containing protein n=1 Tax=Polarella glacialis TaxID=89957 RepID=A0A813D6N6_POLGL|nr:unnamed protein product [Polarella glacialis]
MHPRSDVASCLAALGTTLTIFQAKGKTSEVSVQDYIDGAFPGAEDTTLIVAGKIPLPQENDGQTLNLFRCYKTAQRHVNSHSIVNGCFLLSVDLQTKTVKGARLFFGGVCQKLLRASKMEAALEGKPVDSDETYQAALQALSEDIAGAGGICKDPKISEAYRLALAKAHFFRLHLSVLDKLGVLPAHNSSALTPFATAASRPAIKAKQSFDVQKEHAPVSEAIPKLGAIMSTSGEAIYPSDRFAASPNTLYGAFVIADRANRKLLSLDASAALSSPGVVDFLTAADVPRGKTLQNDEPLFCAAGEVVPYEGAAVGFVVAESAELALAAVSKVRLTWDGTGSRLGTSSQPITNLQAARQRGSFITNAEMDKKLARLDEAGGLRRRGLPLHRACFSVDQQESEEDRRNRGGAVSSNLHEVSGEVKTGGQLHFYMEPQTTMAIPTEDGGLELWCGTQFPAFTQLTVCQLLGLPAHQVNIKVRRVGGAFGGKLSRQGPLAAACSLAALKSRRPIFGCNERLTDMRMTQGREQCEVTYSATCDNDGRVESLEMDWHIDVGWDGTDAAGDIAMLVNFSDNAFYTPNFKCNSTAYKSHTVPRTSVRAPGVIQSITAHEVIMEHVSRSLGLDFEWVQEKNFYQPGQKTPWGDVIGSDAFNWTMPQVWAKLREDSSFDLRRQAVERFNAGSRWRKRGIAMTPVKYGMGLDVFQAMATVCIFSADGTVLVNHNGCEIGQGIHTKVAQVVAYSLGLDLSMVRIADTESNQAPNTAATGGSGTSETSAQAARVACEELSKRLAPYLAKEKDSWLQLELFFILLLLFLLLFAAVLFILFLF